MATESATGLSDHARGVTVTTIACLAGIGAAFASAFLFGTSAQAAQTQIGWGVVVAFVIVQLPLLQLLGVDVTEFGPKDFLFVAFMTFALWFISYAVMLTSAVSL